MAYDDMMTTRKKLLYGGIALVVAAIPLYSYLNPTERREDIASTQNSKKPEKITITRDASYVAGGVREYAEMAHAVVIGKTVLIEDALDEHDLPYRRAHIEVEKVLKGKITTNEVVVHMYGGESKTHVVVARDTPKLHIGTQGVFFLIEGKKGEYTIFADAHGYAPIINQNDRTVAMTMEGAMDVSSLEAIVREYADTQPVQAEQSNVSD